MLLLFASCRINVLRGEGQQVTSNPQVAAFNAIDLDVSLKAVINIQPGSQPGIQFKSYENILKHIKTKVEGGTLRIYSDLDDTWTMSGDDVAMQITMPSISGLSLSGSPDAVINGNITGSDFKLDISGASDVKIDNVNVDNFAVTVSGAGDIEVKGGAVKHASYDINGAGTLKAFPLQADEASATISGAGTSTVTALNKLTANINGAGTIRYKGHPTITQQVSGVGTISEAN
jgi:hypothetical protein